MENSNKFFLCCRGFIKGQAPGKLTGCERDLAINLPGCFHLLFLLSFIRKTKNARLETPTDLTGAQKLNETPGVVLSKALACKITHRQKQKMIALKSLPLNGKKQVKDISNKEFKLQVPFSIKLTFH